MDLNERSEASEVDSKQAHRMNIFALEYWLPTQRGSIYPPRVPPRKSSCTLDLDLFLVRKPPFDAPFAETAARLLRLCIRPVSSLSVSGRKWRGGCCGIYQESNAFVERVVLGSQLPYIPGLKRDRAKRFLLGASSPSNALHPHRLRSPAIFQCGVSLGGNPSWTRYLLPKLTAFLGKGLYVPKHAYTRESIQEAYSDYPSSGKHWPLPNRSRLGRVFSPR